MLIPDYGPNAGLVSLGSCWRFFKSMGISSPSEVKSLPGILCQKNLTQNFIHRVIVIEEAFVMDKLILQNSPAHKLTKKIEIVQRYPEGWFAMQASLDRRYGRFDLKWTVFASIVLPNGLTLIVQNPKHWPHCRIWSYQRGGITWVDGNQDVKSTTATVRTTFLVIVCWICSQRGYVMYTCFTIKSQS